MNPNEAAEKRILLSEEYSRFSDEMGELEQDEANYFVDEREGHKSDKSCQRAFDATDEGQRLIFLKRKTKGTQEVLNALASYIAVANNQARNAY